ncbi:MAG: hypothetical protein L6308_06760 [Candidatus Omnitrophica bacterium]|nr:hypothetical protein [Candidatus Omnitrophota bacterium]MDO9573136.1 hypothetical protein [Candidatus Omnitrophota bacterium]
MDFNAIRKDIKALNFDSLRTDCDNFFEGVIIKDELGKLNAQLINFLGEPVYPSKNRLPHKAQETIDGFGGVTSGQTLYYKNLGSDSIFAMLWPWKDGQRTTVKIIQS